MSLRDEFGQVFRTHSLRTWDSRKPADEQTECRCGWVGADLLGHHLDQALTRFGVVELPKPVLTDVDVDECEDPYEFRAPWGSYFVVRGSVESDSGPSWSPAHARLEAAALLAAANRAESQS
ncbi:hypothetical protein [Rhodococcus pyridinivorans]|uniref:hypothetical protein n=1 Tax=Rhodococcus pyridinivorans TaxID=103816 RepID=UPI003AAAFD2E